jgi:hypothetical protein
MNKYTQEEIDSKIVEAEALLDMHGGPKAVDPATVIVVARLLLEIIKYLRDKNSTERV